MPLALLFGAAHIGGITVGFLLAQLLELGVDTHLQFIALGQQQRTEEALLGFIHVVGVWLGQEVLFSHGGRFTGQAVV